MNNGPHLFRLDPSPEIGELDGVEECDYLNNDSAAHAHVPRVSVSVGLAVACRSLRIEQRNYHVAIGVNTAEVFLSYYSSFIREYHDSGNETGLSPGLQFIRLIHVEREISGC
jgi:hypothetical protein